MFPGTSPPSVTAKKPRKPPAPRRCTTNVLSRRLKTAPNATRSTAADSTSETTFNHSTTAERRTLEERTGLR